MILGDIPWMQLPPRRQPPTKNTPGDTPPRLGVLTLTDPRRGVLTLTLTLTDIHGTGIITLIQWYTGVGSTMSFLCLRRHSAVLVWTSTKPGVEPRPPEPGSHTNQAHCSEWLTLLHHQIRQLHSLSLGGNKYRVAQKKVDYHQYHAVCEHNLPKFLLNNGFKAELTQCRPECCGQNAGHAPGKHITC